MRSIKMLTINHHNNFIHITLRIATTLILTTILALLIAAPPFVHGDELSTKLISLKAPPIIGTSLSLVKVELNGNFVKPGEIVPAKNFRDLKIDRISWSADSSSRYTFLLLDLDRKSGNNLTAESIYNQFTSLNIPGSKLDAGITIAAPEPPSVPCQTGVKHRILLVALLQDQLIEIKDVIDLYAPSGYSKARENFKLNDFINQHRLSPEAANIFYAASEVNGVCSGGTSSLKLVPSSATMMVFGLVIMIAGFIAIRR